MRLVDGQSATALRDAVGELEVLAPGVRGAPRPESAPVAVLVLDGAVVLRRTIAGSDCAEVLGEGDVLLCTSSGPDGSLSTHSTWDVVTETRVVWLGAPFARAARDAPGLALAVMERIEQRIERMATLNAINRMLRIDARVLAAMWHFSDRWGHVGPDGVLLKLGLTHRAIAGIVGARRPSVTTAMSELQRQGHIARDGDGWLLRGSAPQNGAARNGDGAS
jgi:CRP-like cAMP-binding protein